MNLGYLLNVLCNTEEKDLFCHLEINKQNGDLATISTLREHEAGSLSLSYALSVSVCVCVCVAIQDVLSASV